jgi:hypothetical protein
MLAIGERVGEAVGLVEGDVGWVDGDLVGDKRSASTPVVKIAAAIKFRIAWSFIATSCAPVELFK